MHNEEKKQSQGSKGDYAKKKKGQAKMKDTKTKTN